MFANTLTLTIGGVAKTLNRNNQDDFGSTYQFRSGTEYIRMQVRHTSDKLATGEVLRHNVYVERTVFATPTATEKYMSVTATLRGRYDTDPAELLATWIGVNTLLLALDDGLVVGEN
jgi:hypothetical protein